MSTELKKQNSTYLEITISVFIKVYLQYGQGYGSIEIRQDNWRAHRRYKLVCSSLHQYEQHQPIYFVWQQRIRFATFRRGRQRTWNYAGQSPFRFHSCFRVAVLIVLLPNRDHLSPRSLAPTWETCLQIPWELNASIQDFPAISFLLHATTELNFVSPSDLAKTWLIAPASSDLNSLKRLMYEWHYLFETVFIIFILFPFTLGKQSMFQDDASSEALEGPVNFAHQFVDMPNYSVEIQDPVDGPKTVRNKS